ncbi:MAG: hypothetical protein ACI4KA_01115 [Oscillospiraceae bacterium]
MNNNNFFPFERNRYFYGKMLTARDFEIEQRYYNNKRRLLNRVLFGAGVICGLGVYQNDDTSFSVETGMALDYQGREIVVPTPVIRKLQMVDGYDSLLDNSGQAYLCLKYDQQNREPVNNIGASDHDSENFNKIEEGYKLYLSTDAPLLEDVYNASGMNTVTVVYNAHGLRIVMIVPKLVISEDDTEIKFVVLKGIDSQPVSFRYRFESEYFRRGSDNTIEFSFSEDSSVKKDVFTVDFTVKALGISDMIAALSKGRGELEVRMGDVSDKVEVGSTEVYICADSDSFDKMKNTRMSTLENNLSGENTPIYLAKIDCLNIGTGFIIRNITPLPFAQRTGAVHDESSAASSGISEIAAAPVLQSAKSDNFLKGGVSTEVEQLEYWQKPQVNASYNQKSKKLNFRFGIPSSEAYDYATSSGVVDIPISGAIRVNARFFSQEIPHNLGVGDVSLTLSVEFSDSGSRKLLFGSGEVFAAKSDVKVVPRVETAAVLNPETGTFKVGLRLIDYVEGHTIRVRWFAYKPTRDTAEMHSKDTVVIRITPEIQKIKPLERVRFKADIEGTENKTALWSVNDADGGNIDENGLYQAPSAPGTYEIVACSSDDHEKRTSAFVIVEE